MKELTLKDLDDGVTIVMPNGIKYKACRESWELTEDTFFPWHHELRVSLKGHNFRKPTEQPKSEQENIMKKEFTKADLKSGMKVVLRDGGCYTVFLSTKGFGDVIVNDTTDRVKASWSCLSNYKDDLKANHDVNYDIVKVYTLQVYDLTENGVAGCELLWKREEKTQEQIAYEALQAQIAEEEARHADSIKALRKEAEKLKPKIGE